LSCIKFLYPTWVKLSRSRPKTFQPYLGTDVVLWNLAGILSYIDKRYDRLRLRNDLPQCIQIAKHFASKDAKLAHAVVDAEMTMVNVNCLVSAGPTLSRVVLSEDADYFAFRPGHLILANSLIICEESIFSLGR
jgi:hypothetical protein